MRFLYITDIHNRSERDTPAGRTDNYYQSVLTKQEEVKDLIRQHKPDVLLFGGDLFHRFDAPRGLVNDVLAIWRTYDIPALAVIGSHDYNGFQMKTLRSTALGSLVSAGLVDIIDHRGDDFQSSVEPAAGIRVVSTPHTVNLADEAANFATTVIADRRASYDFVIQLVHGDVFPTYVPWQHQLIADIHPYIAADLVLCGHIHAGWSPAIMYANEHTVTRHTMYMNPGSIGRTENATPRSIHGILIDVAQNRASATYKTIQLHDVVPHPFVTKIEKIEGSPVTDFSGLMRLIEDTKTTSELKAQRHDFRDMLNKVVDHEYAEESPAIRLEIKNRAYHFIEHVELGM